MTKKAVEFISEVLLGEIRRIESKEIEIEDFYQTVDVLERYKFTPEHDQFFPTVKLLAMDVYKVVWEIDDDE